MENRIFKSGFSNEFDFVEISFRRLGIYFQEGLTHKQYRQLAGRLLSLKKEDAKKLLRAIKARYPIIVNRRGIVLNGDFLA